MEDTDFGIQCTKCGKWLNPYNTAHKCIETIKLQELKSSSNEVANNQFDLTQDKPSQVN